MAEEGKQPTAHSIDEWKASASVLNTRAHIIEGARVFMHWKKDELVTKADMLRAINLFLSQMTGAL